MKHIYILSLASVVLFASCTKDEISGSGHIGSEGRHVSNFTSVQVTGATNVIINQGSQFTVEVNGYSNLLPYFETQVVNGALQLRYKNYMHVRNDNVQVLITMPVLSGIAISGSGNIQAYGNFRESSSIEARISGSGNIIIVQGATDYFYSSISGSGNIHAYGIQSKKAEVNSSGSGNVELSCSDELMVRISGSGDVYYNGAPVISAQITGSGNVIRR